MDQLQKQVQRSALELHRLLQPGRTLPLNVTNEGLWQAAVQFMDPAQHLEHAIFAHRGASLLAAILRAALVEGIATKSALELYLFHPQGLEGATRQLQAWGDPMIDQWLAAFLGSAPDQVDWQAVDRDRFLKTSGECLVSMVMHWSGSHIAEATTDDDTC